MLADALIFLIKTGFGLFTIALLLRFYMQWARAAYRNPLSDFLAAVTDFIVRPGRRFIPGLWGLDLATLVIAWAVQFIELALVLQIDGPRITGVGDAVSERGQGAGKRFAFGAVDLPGEFGGQFEDGNGLTELPEGAVGVADGLVHLDGDLGVVRKLGIGAALGGGHGVEHGRPGPALARARG